MNVQLNPYLRYTASASLIGLIALGLAWELFLGAASPGWLLIGVESLAFIVAFARCSKGNVYTMQWASMLILLYFMEGVVRAYSDPNAMSAMLAGVEIVLSFVFYICALMYLRPAKKAAQAAKKAANAKGAK